MSASWRCARRDAFPVCHLPDLLEGRGQSGPELPRGPGWDPRLTLILEVCFGGRLSSKLQFCIHKGRCSLGAIGGPRAQASPRPDGGQEERLPAPLCPRPGVPSAAVTASLHDSWEACAVLRRPERLWAQVTRLKGPRPCPSGERHRADVCSRSHTCGGPPSEHATSLKFREAGGWGGGTTSPRPGCRDGFRDGHATQSQPWPFLVSWRAKVRCSRVTAATEDRGQLAGPLGRTAGAGERGHLLSPGATSLPDAPRRPVGFSLCV